MLKFRYTGKDFELKGDLLNMITNKKFNVDLASSSDKKIKYDFAMEMNFDVKTPGKKCNRDRTLIKFFISPSLMICASGNSNTLFLPSDPNELCDRLKLLPQENSLETIQI